ncbi:hypothetical protein [Geotalea toluenoxydans]
MRFMVVSPFVVVLIINGLILNLLPKKISCLVLMGTVGVLLLRIFFGGDTALIDLKSYRLNLNYIFLKQLSTIFFQHGKKILPVHLNIAWEGSVAS